MKELIVLGIALVFYLLHEWWKARQDKVQSDDTSEPWPGQRPPGSPQPRPPSAPPRQSGPVSWEEELRRLLEGTTDRPARPAPPPPVVVSRPAVAPPPLPVPRPVARPAA